MREQARNPEQEKWQLINHPRYHALLSHYGYPPLSYPVKDDLTHLSLLQKAYSLDIEGVQSPNALHHIKRMVALFKKEVREGEEEENDLLGFLMRFAQR